MNHPFILKKISQVRFDIKEGSAWINVNLNPKFFNQGWGTELIKNVTEFFLKENLSVGEVMADIIDGNFVSEKAFLKAGYVLIKKTTQNNRKVNVFCSQRKHN